MDGQLDVWKGKGEPVPEEAARSLLKQMLSGLKFAHLLGIFHADLKPANLFVMKDGLIKIGDFGVARVLASASGHSEQR